MPRIETKLEVVTVPVADVDRAKRFYEGLGWRVDADFSKEGWRVVQLTPPGSACSIVVGKGLTSAAPGSVQGLLLVVDDIQAARADLVAHGASPSEVFHFDGTLRVTGTQDRLPGRTRSAAPTCRGSRSAIRTATAGWSRRSRRAFPVAG